MTVAHAADRGPALAWPAGEAIASAVDAEAAAGRATPLVRDLGPARADPAASAPPWTVFRVDLRGVPLDEAALRELYLAEHEQAPRRGVGEVLCLGTDELVVRALVEPAPALRLFAVVDRAFVLRSLASALRAVTAPGRAGDHVRRVLAAGGEPVDVPRFDEAQRRALGAMLSPGLSVVWGPPGTGTTKVLAEALRRIVVSGRSALLVSPSGVAVDRALERAWREADGPGPGVMVRVGHPARLPVGDHAWLPLARASAHGGGERARRLEELTAKAAEIAAHPELRRLAAEEAELGDVSVAALAAARARLANGERLAAADATVAAAERALAAALRRRGEAAAALAAAEGAMSATRAERAAWRRAAHLGSTAAAAGAAVEEAASDVERLRGELAAPEPAAGGPEDRPWWSALRARRNEMLARRELEERLAAAEAELARRGLLRDEARAAAEAATTAITSRPGHVGAAEAEAVETRHLEAAAAMVEAADDVGRAGEALALARHERAAAADLPLGGAGDAALVDRAAREGLAERAAAVAALRAELAPLLAQQAHALAECRHASHRLAELAGRTVGRAQVVATTLATLAVDVHVAGRRYDHVIVDEASAALAPHVVHAATLAEVGVALVGDFNQNGPVSSVASRAGDDPQALPAHERTWLCQDVFEYLGLDSPEAMGASPGAVTLTHQYRFGPAATELANRIGYGGALRQGATSRWRPARDGLGEIVFVDTQPLGDLAAVRKDPGGRRGGRWWAVGAALSLGLAERHAAAGGPVGILTPYTLQRRLTEDLVVGSAPAPLVEVGTPGRFQGRAFPVVVLDLVEDGGGTSWVARARSSGRRWHRDGVRVVNVALTRNGGRLYVVGDVRAVETARDGPLAELWAMMRDGRITVLDADTVLGRGTGPSEAGEEAAPTRLLDAGSLPVALEAAVDSARRSVAVWAPSLAPGRVRAVAPWLEAAVARGARVTVFTKPTEEHRRNAPALLQQLDDAGARVVPVWGMHEKLAVVDGATVFAGGVNLLAGGSAAAELVVESRGRRFAERLLDLERASAFEAGAGVCERHGVRRHARRLPRTPPWRWVCGECPPESFPPVRFP